MKSSACLELARRAITHHFKTGGRLPTPIQAGRLKEKRGAFVTLNVAGDLRGCIGYPLPVEPLDETIIEMAVAASTGTPGSRRSGPTKWAV